MARKKTVAQEPERTQPWLWEHRVGVTPFAISLLLLFWTFVLPGLVLSTSQFFTATGVVAAVTLLGTHRKWGGKKVADKQMRWYVDALVITATGLIVTVKVWGELTRDWLMWGFVVWLTATLFFGAFWWNDHSNLLRIRKEKEVLHWPVLAERINMKHLHKSAVKETATGKRVRLWWDKGLLKKSTIKAHLEDLESVLDIPGGLAKLEDVYVDGEIDVNQYELVWNDKAPGRKEAIDFTEPTAHSAMDLLTIAYREDGEPVQMQIYDQDYGGQHMLAGGTTGSGKSGFYHLLLAETANARDIVRWGMDFKGGMSFRPWAPLFDWFIDDETDALDMMSAARAVIEARAKYAAARKWDPWQVDEDHPLLVICVDECAVLFGQGAYQLVELGKIIAQQGRGVGVILCLATQHATNEAVGSQQIMKNITRRMCFRCSDTTQQSVLLPNGWDKVDATAIPAGKKHAGKAYWSDGGEIDTLMMRIRFVTKKKIQDLVSAYWEYRCDLDKGTARAAQIATQRKDGTNGYDLRKVWTLDDLGPNGGTDGMLPDEVLDDDQIWDQIFGVGATGPVDTAYSGSAPVQDEVAPTPIPEAEGLVDDDEEMPMYDERGDDVSISDLVEPTNQDDKDLLDAAIAAWNEERSDRVTKEEAEERLHRALLAAGREGAQFGDLVKITGRKKTWTGDELLRLQGEGKVVRPAARGAWAYSEVELSRHLTRTSADN